MRDILSNFKAARKTMPSARKSISKSRLNQTRKIYQLIPNAEIRTPVHLIPNGPNLRVFVMNTLPNVSVQNTSGLNFKATEQISADVACNQIPSEMEKSSKSICEQYSSRFTPIPSKGESGGIHNYGKRLVGRMHLLNNLSRNKSLKVMQEIRKCPRKTCCNLTKTTHIFQVSDAKKLENIQLKHLKEKLSRSVLPTFQNEKCSDQNSNSESFQNPLNSGEMNKKQVKHVKFSEKDSQYAVRMKTAPPARVANFPLHKIPGHKFSQILIRHNLNGNSIRDPASQNVSVVPMKEGSVPRLNMGNNNIRLDNLKGCLRGVSPVCSRMLRSDIAPSDPDPFLYSNFPVHSSTRRMMGAGMRGPTCQNEDGAQLVKPNPFYSLQNSRLPFISVAYPPGLETSKFCASAHIRDSRGKNSAICSQTLATESYLNVGGSKRNVTNGARKEENTRDSIDCQAASSNQGLNKEDKISNTRRMLDDIAELLNDINVEMSGDFECNGLELSLSIWKKELEQCILSVEKIKKSFLDHLDRK